MILKLGIIDMIANVKIHIVIVHVCGGGGDNCRLLQEPKI